MHTVDRVADLRQIIHDAKDICDARRHDTDGQAVERHDRSDHDRRYICDLPYDIECRAVFGGDVCLRAISIAQRGVHFVKFILFKTFVGKRADQPHRIYIFLHIQVHVRIPVADIRGDAARRFRVFHERHEQKRCDDGRQDKHIRTRHRKRDAGYDEDERTVKDHKNNAAVHLLEGDYVCRKRGEQFSRIIRGDGRTVQIDELFISDIPQFVLELQPVILKENIPQIHQPLSEQFESGKNPRYNKKQPPAFRLAVCEQKGKKAAIFRYPAVIQDIIDEHRTQKREDNIYGQCYKAYDLTKNCTGDVLFPIAHPVGESRHCPRLPSVRFVIEYYK